MHAIMILTIFVPTICFSSQILAPGSETLAYCEGVYLYSAQYLQMMGKEGAAKNVLTRAARTTSANFMANEVDGVISKEKIGKFREASRKVKPRFDANPELIVPEVDECDKNTKDLINIQIRARKLLWGKTFPELHEMMLRQYMGQMGIR